MIFFNSFFNMFYAKFSILVVTVLWLKIVNGDGECKYSLGFSSNCKDCENFKNEKYDPSNLKMTPAENEDGETVGSLSGYLTLNANIVDGYKINIEVMKETETGLDPVMSATADVCTSLNDDDAPWWPLIQAMNVTKCPIPEGEYTIEKMFIDLKFAENALNSHYCGEYFIQISITDKADTMSCSTLGAIISEYDC